MIRRKSTRNPADTSYFPSGSFVTTQKGEYLIQDTNRLRVSSKGIRESWNFPRTIVTKEENLSKYPIIGVLGYRAGTVVYSLVDGLYYLIEKNKKRQITDIKWFEYLGMDMHDAVVASAEEIKLHKTGEVLN